MKLAIRTLLLLCFLQLSGEGQPHIRAGQEVGAICTKSVSVFAATSHSIFSAPSQSREEAHILAILEDCEDRKEEDELFAHSNPKVGVAHGALCARPRAPGSGLHGNSPARFCKHFAWSSVDRFIVIRVFRV